MSNQELKTLELEKVGGILHLRLNRPERRNAFNGEVISELARSFSEVSEDSGVRVVLLSGKGKSFSAGADLNWMQEQADLPAAENAAGAEEMARMFLAIARCKKPVVARIHGHALGGGSGLTAAADIAICAENTVFGLTEVKLGIIPAVISPFVLQKIGVSKARALFLTGERFDGREAERIGLVHRALPEDKLDQEVERVITELRSAGPEAIAQAKTLIQEVADLSLEDAIPLTSRRIAELRATPEAREGMGAFLDKRKPQWLE